MRCPDTEVSNALGVLLEKIRQGRVLDVPAMLARFKADARRYLGV
jgi:hypothetical protein